ncbi:hypothetical protein KY362_07045 [Candidatus Woesearchaeota archaeon]|nr:hypothetical protein [Candidatus Woesearchaeota archaeon]
MSEERMRKVGEHASVTGGRLHHNIEDLKRQFADTPEGVEAVFLEKILEAYIKNRANFLAHFISGEPGKRGIDLLIQGLEHPQSKVKPDKKLLKQLKKMGKKLHRLKLPTYEEWNHYNTLEHEIHELRPNPKLHEFVEQFMVLHKKAMKYPETPVAKIMLRRNPKITPHMMQLENFELMMFVYKFLLSRLYRPDQESQARNLLGHDFMQDKEALDNMFRRVKMTLDGFLSEAQKCFAKEREDENMSNIRALAAAMTSQGNKIIFARMLTAAGLPAQAKALVASFGSKGKQRTDPNTANKIAIRINTMQNRSVEQKVEMAAAKELFTFVFRTVEYMQKLIEAARKAFEKVLTRRIKELHRKHAKELTAFRKMDAKFSQRTTEVLCAAASGDALAGRINQARAAKQQNYLRASDILAVKQARLIYFKRLMGWINDDDVDKGIKDLMAEKPAPFAVTAINNIRYVFQQRMSGMITDEQFRQKDKAIQDYIKQLDQQLNQVPQNLLKADAMMEESYREWQDMAKVVEIDMKEMEKDSTKIERKLHAVSREETQNIDAEHGRIETVEHRETADTGTGGRMPEQRGPAPEQGREDTGQINR